VLDGFPKSTEDARGIFTEKKDESEELTVLT
jgi:hypothetical protein